MKRNWREIVLMGFILAEFLAVGFDVVFNGSRIVKPIDLGSYVFPMDGSAFDGCDGGICLLCGVFGDSYGDCKF